MRRIATLLIGLLFLFTSIISHGYQSGVSLSLPIISKDPENLHGLRASYWFQPNILLYNKFQVYFDVAAARWYVSNKSTPYNSLNAYSIAPVLRVYIKKYRYLSPYFEVSIGATYLTKTHFSNQNLGMHFAFQDLIGIGTTIGKEQKIFISADAMHYSNGSLCSRNSGITIPLLVRMGYKFG